MSFTAPTNNYNFKKKHFDKIALIDADKLKHLVAHDIYKYLNQNYTRQDFEINNMIDDRLEGIFSMFTARNFVFLFSGPSSKTFRNSIGFEKKYKGNRTDSSYYEGKYEDMAYVVSYIQNKYPVLVYPDLEADDLLSMLQCEETFIFSNDKDLKQVPGWHYSILKSDLEYVTMEEAILNLATQLLTGDSVDNISGIPGVGAKSALKILENVKPKSLIHTVIRQYMNKYGIVKGIDAFVENWFLVKLRVDRGTYFKEKYKDAFLLIEHMKK